VLTVRALGRYIYMAPLFTTTKTLSQALYRRSRYDTTMAEDLRSQWRNPSDILSLLLIIGGDVVQKALAQQTGDRWPSPVAFSFGWVAYSFAGLLSAVSDNLLLPDPDYPVTVLTIPTGHERSNRSWILGRLLRDYEKLWMPKEVRDSLEVMLSKTGQENGEGRRRKAGLCISVFEASQDAEAGVPFRDIYWKSGYFVVLFQLSIAAIPWGIWGAWDVFAITVGGTLLAYITEILPQWRRERWQCRKNSKKTVVLCRGNGAQHALVILGSGRGLDLEDLAASGDGIGATWVTRWSYAILLMLWVVLLITVSGIKEHTWFLVAIGAFGMLHTVVIAGSARRPEAFGIPLKFKNVFVQPKVSESLRLVELEYPTVGNLMMKMFLPGGARLKNEGDRLQDEDLNLAGSELSTPM